MKVIIKTKKRRVKFLRILFQKLMWHDSSLVTIRQRTQPKRQKFELAKTRDENIPSHNGCAVTIVNFHILRNENAWVSRKTSSH